MSDTWELRDHSQMCEHKDLAYQAEGIWFCFGRCPGGRKVVFDTNDIARFLGGRIIGRGVGAREAAAAVLHMCGMHGFGQDTGDYCPGCDRLRASFTEEAT